MADSEDVSEIPSTGASEEGETVPSTETSEPALDSAWFLELPKVSELPPEKQEAALRLWEDDVLEGGLMELVSLSVEDMDENGQLDCVAMLRDSRDDDPYGHGCVYIYFNEEEPYRFYDEDWPYLFGVDVRWADLTSDGRVELILWTMGTGVGAVGDHYLAVLSDTGEGIKELDFPPVPKEMSTDYSPGVRVEVYMETEEDMYSAYCPYLEERIEFHSPWTDRAYNLASTEPILVGNNVRGFYVPVFDEENGQTRLIVSEYLSGEGGVVHCVGVAFFSIEWDEDGTSRIAEWWIES